MEKYHKINSLYKRDAKGKFTKEFSTPEFEYLFYNEWVGTEKIDGTNIRIHWDGDRVSIAGRTDRSQINPYLLKRLNEIAQSFVWENVFIGSTNITLYGEGYGHRIQSGGDYIKDGVDFILFDIFCPLSGFFSREGVSYLAKMIGIKSVPIIYNGDLSFAEHIVATGFPSTIGSVMAEGLVLTPKVPLYTSSGQRIITKLKTKDLRK